MREEPMPKKPETLFKEKVKAKIKPLPRSWWFKTQLVALRGIPDLIGCVNGQMVALELKKDDASLCDPLQQFVLRQIIKAGGIGLVVTPNNFDSVYRVLKEMSEAKLLFRPLQAKVSDIDS